MGWSAVTVTAYALPSWSPSVLFGSTNFDLPGSMMSGAMLNGAAVLPRSANCTFTVVVAVPRFCMMKGVTKPVPPPRHPAQKRRVMFGRKTLLAPAEKPSYESASARLPTPWCSFTTLTIAAPYERTTTANWLSPGRFGSLFGTYAYEVPGPRSTLRRFAHEPSLNLYQLTSRVVFAAPTFCVMNGVWKPVGPPSVFVMFGR